MTKGPKMTTETKEEGGKFVVLSIFVATNMTKLTVIFEKVQKKIGAHSQRILVLLVKKIAT
jgi:hypothetical protein